MGSYFVQECIHNIHRHCVYCRKCHYRIVSVVGAFTTEQHSLLPFIASQLHRFLTCGFRMVIRVEMSQGVFLRPFAIETLYQTSYEVLLFLCFHCSCSSLPSGVLFFECHYFRLLCLSGLLVMKLWQVEGEALLGISVKVY